jgi:hypothetical protein
MVRIPSFAVAVFIALPASADEPPTHPAKDIPPAQLRLTTRIVPLGVETNRMRGVTFDANGTAWIGLVESDRRQVLKADPKTGQSELVRVTTKPSTDKLYMDYVVPVGNELFVCGGYYPRQIIFDPKSGRSREFDLNHPGPEIFNAIVVDDAVYSVDGNHGIYGWQPGEWTSEFFPWPRPGKGPFAGAYVAADHALYCPMWWTNGMAETQPLLRFDLKSKAWSTLDPPWPGSKPMVPIEIDGKLYVADMFSGHLMVFDIARRQFTARHQLPGHGKTWKYLATHAAYGPFVVCVLSTFAGVPNAEGSYGFDGHPHHFVNRILVFDTRDAASIMLPVPSASGDGYATIAYARTHGESLYLTCVDSPRAGDRPQFERGPAYLVEMQITREE